jgi:hypothetical protein
MSNAKNKAARAAEKPGAAVTTALVAAAPIAGTLEPLAGTPIAAPAGQDQAGAADGAAAAPVLTAEPLAQPAKKEPTHHVSGVPEKGFYRAGRHWPREGVEVVRADFTDAQWVALEAEPNIVIKSL